MHDFSLEVNIVCEFIKIIIKKHSIQLCNIILKHVVEEFCNSVTKKESGDPLRDAIFILYHYSHHSNDSMQCPLQMLPAGGGGGSHPTIRLTESATLDSGQAVYLVESMPSVQSTAHSSHQQVSVYQFHLYSLRCVQG